MPATQEPQTVPAWLNVQVPEVLLSTWLAFISRVRSLLDWKGRVWSWNLTARHLLSNANEGGRYWGDGRLGARLWDPVGLDLDGLLLNSNYEPGPVLGLQCPSHLCSVSLWGRSQSLKRIL